MSDTKDIAVLNGETPVIKLSATEAAIAALQAEYKGVVFDLTDKAGMTAAKEARRKLVSLRTGIEAKRKDLKAPALAFTNQLDAEAKRLTKLVAELEAPIDAAITNEEKRLQEIRSKAEKMEADRVRGHQAELSRITMLPSRCTKLSVEQLQQEIDCLKLASDRAWDEYEDRAAECIEASIDTLRMMITSRQAAEVQREHDRIEGLRRSIRQYQADINACIGLGAALIRTQVNELSAAAPTAAEFGALFDEAIEAHEHAMAQGRALIEQAEAAEAAEAERRARAQLEQAESNRKRAKLELRQLRLAEIGQRALNLVLAIAADESRTALPLEMQRSIATIVEEEAAA